MQNTTKMKGVIYVSTTSPKINQLIAKTQFYQMLIRHELLLRCFSDFHSMSSSNSIPIPFSTRHTTLVSSTLLIF